MRLTATYAVLFLLAGALLLALTYFVVKQSLPSPPNAADLGNKAFGTVTTLQTSGAPGLSGGQTIIRVANEVQQQVLLNLLIESGVALAH